MLENFEPFKRRLTRAIKRRMGLYSAAVTEMPAPCMHCGCRFAVPITLPVIPDFDTSALPQDVARRLVDEKHNGICNCCGLSQAFGRPTAADLHAINRLGKDATTSDETYGTEKSRETGIAQFRSIYTEQRLQRWDEYFSQRDLQPKRALFVRHWFGDTMRYARDRFGCTVAGIDMSEVCRDHVSREMTDAALLEGEINGHLLGPFTETGLYDAIFIWHVLTHASDVQTMLQTLNSLLAPGGFLLLTHEVGPKPTNPFHMIHGGERQVQALLAEHFDGFDIIADCNSQAAEFVRRGSPRHDEADYVVWKRNVSG